MRKSAVLSIDVDSLRFYRRIHGLVGPDDLADDPIYTVAIPRFFDLLSTHGVRATLFLVGADSPRYAEAFAPARNLGCEIASHSYAHDYGLSRRPAAEIRDDLARADAALRPLSPTGRIVGFRAPGYNVSPALLEAVAAQGYAYDSSLLPAPLYFAARAAAIAAYRVRGRRSESVVGRYAAFAGPLHPYRAQPATPWLPDPRGPLWELPMSVEPRTRIPLIGTSWVAAPARLADLALASALRRIDHFHFEMHAIDLLDATDPGVPAALAKAQGDLRLRYADKRAALDRLLEAILRDRPIIPAADLVSHLSAHESDACGG